MRNQVVQEQEKLLGEKNKELEGLKDENKDVKESLKQRGEEVFTVITRAIFSTYDKSVIFRDCLCLYLFIGQAYQYFYSLISDI